MWTKETICNAKHWLSGGGGQNLLPTAHQLYALPSGFGGIQI